MQDFSPIKPKREMTPNSKTIPKSESSLLDCRESLLNSVTKADALSLAKHSQKSVNDLSFELYSEQTKKSRLESQNEYLSGLLRD